MGLIAVLRGKFESFMEFVVVVLMVALAAEVMLGVTFRFAGSSLAWYDEVASVLLAWLTFYGSALAALKRAHIGFPGLVMSMHPRFRIPIAVFTEACVIGFFVLLGWVGYGVLEVLATDHLVSLPAVSVAWTQSVVPVSSALFVIAEVLSLPRVLAEARGHVAADAPLEASH